jgi:hypothetical protein
MPPVTKQGSSSPTTRRKRDGDDQTLLATTKYRWRHQLQPPMGQPTTTHATNNAGKSLKNKTKKKPPDTTVKGQTSPENTTELPEITKTTVKHHKPTRNSLETITPRWKMPQSCRKVTKPTGNGQTSPVNTIELPEGPTHGRHKRPHTLLKRC